MKWIKKLNLLDILIISFFLILLLISLKHLLSFSRRKGTTEPIIYTIQLDKVEESAKEQLQAGKEIFDGNKNYKMGKIKEIQVLSYREEHKNFEEGTIELIEIPDYFKVFLTVKAEANKIGNVFSIKGEEIKVGKDLLIKGKSFILHGLITSIERLDYE